MHNIYECIDEFSINGFILPFFGYQTQVAASSFSPQRWPTSVPLVSASFGLWTYPLTYLNGYRLVVGAPGGILLQCPPKQTVNSVRGVSKCLISCTIQALPSLYVYISVIYILQLD